MKTLSPTSIVAGALLLALFSASPVRAQSALSVKLEGLLANGNLPLSTAFCMPKGSSAVAQDRSPGISWSPGPRGTKSYAIIMVDPDVTADLSLMNKPGVTITVDMPRMNIYHWELVDIPPAVTRLEPGAEGDGPTPGGKPIGAAKIGVRGTNDYWPLFNKNPNMPPAMKGPYGGFDGPCPPSNDEKVHTYKFVVYALDVATLNLSGQFFAPAVLKAMEGHILAQGEANAKFTYDNN